MEDRTKSIEDLISCQGWRSICWLCRFGHRSVDFTDLVFQENHFKKNNGRAREESSHIRRGSEFRSDWRFLTFPNPRLKRKCSNSSASRITSENMFRTWPKWWNPWETWYLSVNTRGLASSSGQQKALQRSSFANKLSRTLLTRGHCHTYPPNWCLRLRYRWLPLHGN